MKRHQRLASAGTRLKRRPARPVRPAANACDPKFALSNLVVLNDLFGKRILPRQRLNPRGEAFLAWAKAILSTSEQEDQ
ncbi:hypothetical protein [Marimonas lutisalis]|uniref:hypothetical protein n=1 Tax=Marimonas lutisalis TaxID=2545756 RepID=UPI0010F7304B|nr:hypothetical protein [Marimonas lutisalis]